MISRGDRLIGDDIKVIRNSDVKNSRPRNETMKENAFFQFFDQKSCKIVSCAQLKQVTSVSSSGGFERIEKEKVRYLSISARTFARMLLDGLVLKLFGAFLTNLFTSSVL